MRVTCGYNDQLEIAMSNSQEEVYKQIREQIDWETILEKYPYTIEKNDSGNWPIYHFGIGYWEESSIPRPQTPAKGDYPDEIVHDHTKDDPAPPRMYFESDWTAEFNDDKVKLTTKVEGAGLISFTIPYDGLWKNAKNALS